MSPWTLMLVLVGAVFAAFKAWTWKPLGPARGLAYALLWPGMDPSAFARRAPAEGLGLLAWGAAKMVLGAALLLGVRTGRPVSDAIVVLLGIGFLVHLGFLDALAGFWRLRGFPVERLFENPAAARSLGEFWGRRWNRAFHHVARERVFRPAARRWGPAGGVLAAFAFSGLVHELLLSVPAGGGYGLPSLYFLLHGALVAAERRWRIGGRTWTHFWVLAPAPLLFHPPFVRALLLPLV
jgi:alginate O-acetyltransferase complex protein AlgI